MRPYTAKTRVEIYAESVCGKKWPDSVPWVGGDGRIYGVWLLGQDYRSKSGYYGSYPPNYLDRVLAMFPDVAPERTLHLFSGSLGPDVPGLRLDRRQSTKPDIHCDAHTMSRHKALRKGVDLILADPPYSAEDAIHYGTSMIKRNIVLQECYKVLSVGGWIVWLDQALPMFRKRELSLAGAILVVRSTNHRFRGVSLFRKVAPRLLRTKVEE